MMSNIFFGSMRFPARYAPFPNVEQSPSGGGVLEMQNVVLYFGVHYLVYALSHFLCFCLFRATRAKKSDNFVLSIPWSRTKLRIRLGLGLGFGSSLTWLHPREDTKPQFGHNCINLATF